MSSTAMDASLLLYPGHRAAGSLASLVPAGNLPDAEGTGIMSKRRAAGNGQNIVDATSTCGGFRLSQKRQTC
jgi:hypothetical protein